MAALDKAFEVRNQYIVDFSFESNGPNVMSLAGEPECSLDIHVGGGMHDKTVAEASGTPHYVDLWVRLRASVGQHTAYIIELKYRADFAITAPDCTDDDAKKIVMHEVPRYLFPYVRQEVARITVEAGFVPLRLSPFDFESMSVQSDQQQAQADSDNTTDQQSVVH